MIGWRRNLAVTWIAQVLSLSGFGFVIPFLPYYIQEVAALSPVEVRAWTGIIASAPAITMGIMAPVWGLVADRYGRKLMLLRAMLFGGVIMIIMSRAETIGAIVVLRALQGLFTGTVGAAAALVASGTPEDRLGTTLGLLSSSTFVGVSLGPFLGGLAAEAFGYTVSFLIGGGILLVGFVLVLALIVEPPRGERWQVARGAADRGARGGASGGGAALSLPGAGSRLDRVRSRLAALSPPVVALFAVIFGLRFSRTIGIPFMPLMVQELRAGQEAGTAAVAGSVQAAAGLATALAGVTLARLGDRMRAARLVFVLLALAGLAALPLLWTRTVGAFAALWVVVAFLLGGIEPTIQSRLSRRTDPARRGLLFGIQTSVGNAGWALAPVVGSGVSIAWGIPSVYLAMSLVLITIAGVGSGIYARHFSSGHHSAAS